MGTINRNRIRLAMDNVLNRAPLKGLVDVLTGVGEQMWQSEDTQVELGIFSNGTIIADASNLASVTFEVKDPTNLLGAPLISVTQSTISIITLANWTNGSAQNALFTLTAAQTNIALLGAQQKQLIAFFYALDTSGTPLRFPLGWGTFQLTDSGYGDVGAITVAAPGARMKNNQLQILCIDDGLYYPVQIQHIGGTTALRIVSPGQS